MQPTSYTISSLWTPSVFVDAGYKHKQVRTCCFSWSSRRNRLVSSRSHLSNDVTCPDKPKTRGNLTSLTMLTRSIAFPTSFPGHDRPKRSKTHTFKTRLSGKMAVFLRDVKVVMTHFYVWDVKVKTDFSYKKKDKTMTLPSHFWTGDLILH